MISGQKKNSRARLSTKSTGFVSGNPGVSANVNGFDQPRLVRFHRAARMSTSSAVRSPDPWNQQTDSYSITFGQIFVATDAPCRVDNLRIMVSGGTLGY